MQAGMVDDEIEGREKKPRDRLRIHVECGC